MALTGPIIFQDGNEAGRRIAQVPLPNPGAVLVVMYDGKHWASTEVEELALYEDPEIVRVCCRKIEDRLTEITDQP
jgi:hypothetical protein